MNRQRKPSALAPTILFCFIFIAELALGIYLSYVREFVYYDAVSRVANSFYVLYSRDPHLGAIGFVWNPLPSLLELLPLLLWPIIPAVASAGLASNIITALFAAGTAVLLFVYCRKSTGSLIISVCLALGYALNPFIFLYGANGMSEAMFAFFIAWIILEFTRWAQSENAIYIFYMGFALALAFWVRYEAVALGISLSLSIIALVIDRRYRKSLFYDWKLAKLESTLISLLTPAIFSGILWVGLNYIIMGDAFYFFHSGYSNIAFSGNLTDEFKSLISTNSGVLWLVLRKSFFFSIPLIFILLIRLLSGRWYNGETIALILLAISIPAMQFVMLWKGSSFGWLRFFMYPYVIAAAWLPYEFSQIRLTWNVYYRPAVAALCISVILSALVIFDMNNQKLSPDEYEVFQIDHSGTHRDLKIAKEVSLYTDKLFENGFEEDPSDPLLILTDSYSAYSVLLNSQYPKNWVITNDRDFDAILISPLAYPIDYILVSKKIGSVLQIIHETYPDLFENRTDWAVLEHDFYGEWKLFRIVK